MLARVILIVCWSVAPAWADEPPAVITGKVIRVDDGQHFVLVDDQKMERRVRLYGIAAPVHGQPYHAKSRENLSRLVHGKDVQVEFVRVGRQGRLLGKLKLNGENINLRQVTDGFAWRDPRHDKDKNEELTDAEKTARKKMRGLWADRSPQPPWEFRREQRQKNKGAGKKEKPAANE
ncbi:MAG: thermonuclease family protein [Planctomycetaceae bacterium]